MGYGGMEELSSRWLFNGFGWCGFSSYCQLDCECWQDFTLQAVYSMETAAAYAVVDWYHGLANSSMTDEQRASLSPDSDEYHWRVGGSKVQVIGWSLYVTTLWLLKVCMSVFYSRLTYVSIHNISLFSFTFIWHLHSRDGLPFMRIRILISYVSIAVTYVVVLVVILAGCHPMHKNWQIYPNPGSVLPALVFVFWKVSLDVVANTPALSRWLPASCCQAAYLLYRYPECDHGYWTHEHSYPRE